MTTVITRERPDAARPCRRFWPFPGLIVVLLGLNVIIVTVTIWCSLADGGHIVEPSYDVRAADYQAIVEARQRQARLRWSVSAEPIAVGEPFHLRLVDARGAALADARVEALIFHHARAGERVAVRFVPRPAVAGDDDGIVTYGSETRADRPGRWRLEVTVTHGNETFLESIDVEVGAAQPHLMAAPSPSPSAPGVPGVVP